MNKAELVEAVQKNLGKTTSKAEAERAVNAVIEGIGYGLKKGRPVQLVGFGTFRVVHRKARLGVNQNPGATKKKKPNKTTKFPPKKKKKDCKKFPHTKKKKFFFFKRIFFFFFFFLFWGAEGDFPQAPLFSFYFILFGWVFL